MFDNLSQSSNRSGIQFANTPRKIIADGEEYDGEYLVKDVIMTSNITIQTPQHIINKVQGDKQVLVRLLQINDQQISIADKQKTIFMAKVDFQRNNFDSTGNQTTIIGYGTYAKQLDLFQLDSQHFQVDSIKPVRIQLYINRRDGQGFVLYNLPQDNISFVQYDIQVVYSFL